MGMTFHGNPIALGTCMVVITSIIMKGSTRVPFPSPVASKMKGMENGIVLWRENNIIICKECSSIMRAHHKRH
jgi:hypothetical protein